MLIWAEYNIINVLFVSLRLGDSRRWRDFAKQKIEELKVAIDKKTVEHVARLSRMELSPEELEKFSGQLENIMQFIDKLKEKDVENVLPTSHILPQNNVLREDVLKKSLDIEKVLDNAPKKDGRFFVVPKIIE